MLRTIAGGALPAVCYGRFLACIARTDVDAFLGAHRIGFSSPWPR